MRVALLSTMVTTADLGGECCGFITVAGRSVIQHQVECALFLGCDKIACHSVALPRKLLDVQHLAEKAGVSFQVISGPRALSGLVKATDELLVFADGLLPDQAAAKAALADRSAVLVISADGEVAASYERIDRDLAWAGILLVRGPAVERLTELSPEADPIAGLLRIALQSGTRIVALPDGAPTNLEWGLVRSEQDARTLGALWLDRHARYASFAAPSLALADRAAIAIITQWHDRRLGSANILAVAAGLGIVAALIGWFWQPFSGIALVAVAYLIIRIGASLGLIEPVEQLALDRSGRAARYLNVALDALLIALTAMIGEGSDRVTAILAITTLLTVLWLGELSPLHKWKILLKDRTLLAATLATAAFFGKIIYFSQILTVIYVLAMVLDLSRSKITRI